MLCSYFDAWFRGNSMSNLRTLRAHLERAVDVDDDRRLVVSEITAAIRIVKSIETRLTSLDQPLPEKE